MNQFIIVTHATLAGGFADVVRFFKSDLENVQFINAYVESQEFEKEFRTALEKVKGENVIVLSDIMGGSVNQVATRLMQEFSYQLITGINLPLLIELKIPKSSLGICEKTWEILKNYNGPYMVQSFNTLGIWWFRRHVPHVLRGQLSSNLTADHLPEPWILTFVVKHLLGNVLGRPDFISYKLADLPMFEVWFLKHILHLPVAVWTLRTPDALKKGKRHYDMQIFEKKNTYY